MPPPKPVVLLVTYTMIAPSAVGGAFFRALRLAVELSDRGWSTILCNYGPLLNDPKVGQAREKVRFIDLDTEIPKANRKKVYRFFKSLNPDMVVFGEGPFDPMKVFFNGARMLRCPFVLLDQYYCRWTVGKRRDVDLLLLHGLKSFWKEDAELRRREVMIPPYIEAVTLKAELPAASDLHLLPWVTFIAYDELVLQKGIKLFAGLEDKKVKDVVFIIISREPGKAERFMKEAGMAKGRMVYLPLQSDADIFGFMGASRVVVVSNGFLQIMQALAMGSPVVCISRGVGMTKFNIDDRFDPFVSIEEDEIRQKERLVQWLANDPFTPDLLGELSGERNGVKKSADLIEQVVKRPLRFPMLLRQAVRFGVDINKLLGY